MIRKHAEYYQQHCSTFGCGNLYWTLTDTTQCPKCGISERMINIAETNDREAVKKYFSNPENIRSYHVDLLKKWEK